MSGSKTIRSTCQNNEMRTHEDIGIRTVEKPITKICNGCKPAAVALSRGSLANQWNRRALRQIISKIGWLLESFPQINILEIADFWQGYCSPHCSIPSVLFVTVIICCGRQCIFNVQGHSTFPLCGENVVSFKPTFIRNCDGVQSDSSASSFTRN